MTAHTVGLDLARRALVQRFGGATEGEVMALAGVANLETNYGNGWKGAGRNSYNMGAIQCGKYWTGSRFSYFDTHPNSDGTSTKYPVDFRRYLTPLDGMVDLVMVAYVNRGRDVVRQQARAEDWAGVSHFLRLTGYYEGFGATPDIRERNHLRALLRGIYTARGEQAPRMLVGCPPTLRTGDSGEAVKLLQTELGLSADGRFGPITTTWVSKKQADCGLHVDGIVGPDTWKVLFGDDYEPAEAA
jgi:peptidoglycan hydrolase-like protein with peptidoglycan-binding domain